MTSTQSADSPAEERQREPPDNLLRDLAAGGGRGRRRRPCHRALYLAAYRAVGVHSAVFFGLLDRMEVFGPHHGAKHLGFEDPAPTCLLGQCQLPCNQTASIWAAR